MDDGDDDYWASIGLLPPRLWTISPEILPPGFEELKEASRLGDLQKVEEILKSAWPEGVPSNEKSCRSLRFAVWAAIDNDHHHITAYLLSHGLSFEMDYAQKAIEKKSYELMEILLAHGWDINAPVGHEDPLALGSIVSDRQMVKWFLSHGADPNAESDLGQTPLSSAVQIAPFETIKLLFEHGGSIEHGELLHFATFRTLPDCTTVLQFLLERGAEINRLQFFGNDYPFRWYEQMGIGTPLYEAAAYGNEAAVRYLLDQGANPLIRTTRGNLPAEVARRTHRETIAQLLESAASAFTTNFN